MGHGQSVWRVIGLAMAALGCTPAQMSAAGPRQASETAAELSCEGLGAEADALWSPESKADISAAIGRLDGAWVGPLRARVLARLDQADRDWALTQAELCQALQRQQLSEPAYAATLACSERARIGQRTVVEALKQPSKANLFRVDRALFQLEEDHRVCRGEAAHSGYVGLATDAGARRARDGQAVARAYRALGDERANAVLDGALAAAVSSGSARAKVGLWLDHSPLLEPDLAAARREARDALNLATVDGYEFGVALAEARLGRLDEREKNFSAALEMYARALARSRRLLGDGHPYVARIYARIGTSHTLQGEHLRAREAYGKALQIMHGWFGEQHPETADAYRRLAIVDTVLGDNPSALSQHGRALDIWRGLLGELHPLTADAYWRVGAAYRRSKDYARALEMVSKALGILRETLGERQVDTADAYFSLGGIHYAMKDYARALANYSPGLEIRREVFGEQHPKVAQGYCETGAAHHGLKDYPRALEGYSRALSIQSQLLDKDDAAAVRTRRAITALCNDGYPPACT